MTQKKYELLTDDTVQTFGGYTLFRIRALVDIEKWDVKTGDLGGYIESERNLTQVLGDARVSGNAQVLGDARVSGNAWVSGSDQFGWVTHVGSKNGTLTWMLDKTGGVIVNRGCFTGTLDQFAAAVKKKHGDTPNGRQYRLLIEFIRLRADEAIKNLSQETGS